MNKKKKHNNAARCVRPLYNVRDKSVETRAQ